MKSKYNKIIWAILIVMTAVTATAYFFLPDTVPMHWGMNGEIDRYGEKAEIFILLGIFILVSIGMRYLPKIDPKYKNYAGFENAYNGICLFMTVFFAIIQMLILFSSFYPNVVRMDASVILLIGILFSVLGYYMPKLKHNYFIGFRTPWTLASEKVWTLTHEKGGKYWFYGGFGMMITAFLPSAARWPLFLLIVIILALWPMVYSYIQFRRQK